MLYNILLVVLVLDAILLIGTVLLQAGKGSGLAANFGGASSSPDAFIGIRQAGTILTKATWWCAGLFLGLAFTLQVMSTRTSAPKSVLEDTFGRPATTAPVSPNAAAPAVPLTPAPGTAGTAAPTTSPLTSPASPPTVPPDTKK